MILTPMLMLYNRFLVYLIKYFKVWIGLFACITFTILALAVLNYEYQGSIKNALLTNGMFVLQTIMSQSSGIYY